MSDTELNNIFVDSLKDVARRIDLVEKILDVFVVDFKCRYLPSVSKWRIDIFEIKKRHAINVTVNETNNTQDIIDRREAVIDIELGL